MSSIFVWKATDAVIPTPSSVLTYYSGSNWFLEEKGTSTQSILFLDTATIRDDVLVYHTQKMPQNWVGSELLEIMEVPYQKIKEDNYAVLEQLGGWMRCTMKEERPFEDLEQEFARIQSWSTLKEVADKITSNTNACLINFNISNTNTHTKFTNHKGYVHRSQCPMVKV